MKIRKFIHTTMILIIVVSISSVTYASMPLKDIIDKQSVNYSPEKNIVLNAQINSKMKPKTPKTKYLYFVLSLLFIIPFALFMIIIFILKIY